MAEQLSIEDFAQRIKAKYPQYKHIPDAELTGKILAKYPSYKSNILPAKPTVPESTAGTRTREATIGVLEPFTAQSLYGTAKEGLSAAYQAITGNPFPAVEFAKNLVTAPIGKVKEYIDAVSKRDWDRAAYAAGGILSQTVPAISGAVETVRGIAPVGALREQARSMAQSATGASAFKTTEPIVEKFTKGTEIAEKKQTAVNKATEELNRKSASKTAAKNAEAEAEYQRKLTEGTAGHKQGLASTLEANREAARVASRVEGVERSLQEGSKRLGEQVKDLDAKLRTEANEKYAAVRDAVKEDPGVPLAGLAEDARYAEQNILKGSQENIRQFRELARKTDEEARGPHTNIGFEVTPGSRLYNELFSAGAIDTGGNIPFDQLQGYSSEIGTKLAKGGLPGDIYQALKYLKEKIDAAKTTIADRNGAGAQLRNADHFWRNYMDAFYDSDSAVAKVRESVGTLDPQFYADAFTKGKAGDVGISRLKQLKTRHGTEASSVADLARNLKAAKTEATETTVPKTKGLPSPPDIPEKPVPVIAEVKQPRTIEKPATPAAEDILKAKREKIQGKASELGQLRRYDLIALAGSVIGPLIGNWARGASLAYLVGEKGLAAALNRPAVIDWISKPVAADLKAIEKLPEPARTELRGNLQRMIDQERAQGRKVAVSAAVQGILQTGAAAGGVKNRREALEKLGRAPQ